VTVRSNSSASYGPQQKERVRVPFFFLFFCWRIKSLGMYAWQMPSSTHALQLLYRQSSGRDGEEDGEISVHPCISSQRQASTSHTGIEKSDEIFCRQNNSVRLPSMPLRFSHTLFIFQLAEKVAPSCFNCIGEKKGRKKIKKIASDSARIIKLIN